MTIGEPFQLFKEEMTPVLHRFSKKIDKEKTLPNFHNFNFKTSWVVTRENYRPVSCMNTDGGILK